MRGKLPVPDPPTITPRITPAGAGKTTLTETSRWICWDHPRRCGENAPAIAGAFVSLGSPPQVRGKLLWSLLCRPLSRITPAGAGKTPQSSNFILFFRDHPRRCGENFNGLPSGFSISRITPAGAGKTMCVDTKTKTPQDHPRRCGENAETEAGYSAMIGSPPQVRGKQRLRRTL